MNKKYLNVILFSALMMGTAGTFTSCKDYDDDIADLNGRVDAVEKGLEALKADFGALGYVKDVTFANGKLTVTKSDGTPVSYDIPDTKDGNTTYSLDVAQKGNSATITLKGSDGSTIQKEINFTDTDTDKFDASQLTYDAATGVVSYKGVATGVKITIPEPEKVSVIKYTENDVVLGWQIGETKLLISDALPITSFEYIPEKILADWGERVIVFEENSYVPKVITSDVVGKDAAKGTYYMPNQAAPQYHVNPSSATIAQLAEEGKPEILREKVEQVTRTVGKFIEWKKSEIDKGVMTVTLEADPGLFEKDQNKLDEIALQFTDAKAGGKITTEYVGVINKTAEIDLVLTDKEVTALEPKDDKCHFAISKADAEAQAAVIDALNMPATTNHHLVQNVTYSKGIAGIDLKELVHACDVKDAAGHKFFDYAAHTNLTLSFKPVSYEVNKTPQEKYMKLDGSKFYAVNYGDVNESCIGKAPMVLAELRDSHNGDALVAAAYIKLLIVGDEAAKPEEDITIDKETTIGIGCNNPELAWTTNDEFMSTQVYTFESNNNLKALSKEQFHTIYAFVSQPSVAEYQNKGNWTVTETINTVDGKANHEVKFVLNNQPLAVGQYYAYGVYQKSTVDADLNKVDNSRSYPMNVVIKYIVNVNKVNFNATSGERVSNAWNADKTAASIYCETPSTTATNSTQIVGDLNELFDGGEVAFTYSSEFDKDMYPSFVSANMNYHFVFSAENLKATRGVVTGVDGTKYQLALNDAKTELHAVDHAIVTVTAADLTAANLVATLAGTNNKDVKYANTDVAKNLLNIAKRDAGSFYAIMDIEYFNGCDQFVTVTNGKFNLLFIRPVNVSSDSSKYFTDGLNEGDSANTLNLADLVIFKDWRYDSTDELNSFAKHLNYYKYYGVTKIDCPDLMKVQTNWGNKGKRTLEAAFGTEQAKKILSINPKVATPDGTTLPDYGTISYIKTSKAEISSYELYIPLTITYTWGTIVEEITVTVQSTK